MPEYTAESLLNTPEVIACPRCYTPLALQALQPSDPFDPKWSALLDHLVTVQDKLTEIQRLVEEVLQ